VNSHHLLVYCACGAAAKLRHCGEIHASMVKAYLRYEHSGVFGVISSNSNVLYDATGKQVITGALENIALWNVRQGTQVRVG
jgi:hypothetical protein